MSEATAVESRIEQVTVYARGARIRRVARVPAPLPSQLRLDGLPLALIDDSVRVEVDGPAVATAVRTRIDVPDGEARAEEPAELRAARRRVALADAELERLAAALAQLGDAPLIVDDTSEQPPAAWAAIVAARRALVAARRDRELALREHHAAARREADDARRELELALDRDRRLGSARVARLHEARKRIELELAPTGAGELALRVEYQVAAARWAPSYVARLGASETTLELRAVVAHDSGEDWTGVALRLSTAEPERWTELPELAPQKIGRRQAEPARRGFREPPSGADALYLDHDRAFPLPRPTRTFDAASVEDDSTYEGRAPTPPPLQREVWDESRSLSSAASLPALAKKQRAATVPATIARAGSVRDRLVQRAPGGGGAAPMQPPAAPGLTDTAAFGGLVEDAKLAARRPREEEAAAAPRPRLDYGDLRMPGALAPDRGRLAPAPPEDGGAISALVGEGAAALAALALPAGYLAEWAHTYDYAFASDGAVDVRGDGAWHSVALTARATTAKLRHVAVPREQADAFRVAAIANPLDGPLLPGPIDVYDRGQFLVTSEVEYAPPGATVEVGLGVDPSVKIARNVEFHEESTGVLRGGLRLVHAIAIEVDNVSPRAIELEIRERVPVVRAGDDDVEVVLGKVDPPWERYTPDPDAPRAERLRGGYRWRIALAPSTKRLLRAGYEVKIAGKHELVGGNRREP